MDTPITFIEKISLQKSIYFFLLVSLLSLPMSSTAKSIAVGAAIISILLTPSYRIEINRFIAYAWCKAALCMFTFVLIATLWSPASLAEKLLVIEKYSKLLYLPILVAGFAANKTRYRGLQAFLIAMVITSSISILKYHGYLQFLNIDPDHVFRNHIMTGFMIAFASYLSLFLLHKQKGYICIAYLLMALLFSYQLLFVSSGRTGYVIYLLLMILLIVQICTWRQAIAGVMLISSLFAVSYCESPVMKKRVYQVVSELKEYKQNDKNTSVGYRLQFHEFAQNLFQKHPLTGNGTASFPYYFRTLAPVPSWGAKLLEPHSQYWLTAAEFGLIGIVLLFWLFLALFKAALKLDKMRPVALAMLIPFIIGNLTDSLLFYSGSGYFFILFMALCLGEQSQAIDQYPSKI